MTYRVKRRFEGAGGKVFSPGAFIQDPAWPEGNVKALLAQQYIEVYNATPSRVVPVKGTTVQKGNR